MLGVGSVGRRGISDGLYWILQDSFALCTSPCYFCFRCVDILLLFFFLTMASNEVLAMGYQVELQSRSVHQRPFTFSHCCSVAVLSDSLQLHGLKHARLPCPSPSPGACSNSCALSRWCHPTISSSVTPFSSCLQSFLASGSFPMSQLFTSGGQILELQLQHQSFSEYSALISFRTDWFDLLAVQGTLKSLLQHQNLKASILWCLAFFMVQLSHLYMTTEKTSA